MNEQQTTLYWSSGRIAFCALFFRILRKFHENYAIDILVNFFNFQFFGRGGPAFWQQLIHEHNIMKSSSSSYFGAHVSILVDAFHFLCSSVVVGVSVFFITKKKVSSHEQHLFSIISPVRAAEERECVCCVWVTTNLLNKHVSWQEGDFSSSCCCYSFIHCHLARCHDIALFKIIRNFAQ